MKNRREDNDDDVTVQADRCVTIAIAATIRTASNDAPDTAAGTNLSANPIIRTLPSSEEPCTAGVGQKLVADESCTSLTGSELCDQTSSQPTADTPFCRTITPPCTITVADERRSSEATAMNDHSISRDSFCQPAKGDPRRLDHAQAAASTVADDAGEETQVRRQTATEADVGTAGREQPQDGSDASSTPAADDVVLGRDVDNDDENKPFPSDHRLALAGSGPTASSSVYAPFIPKRACTSTKIPRWSSAMTWEENMRAQRLSEARANSLCVPLRALEPKARFRVSLQSSGPIQGARRHSVVPSTLNSVSAAAAPTSSTVPESKTQSPYAATDTETQCRPEENSKNGSNAQINLVSTESVTVNADISTERHESNEKNGNSRDELEKKAGTERSPAKHFVLPVRKHSAGSSLVGFSVSRNQACAANVRGNAHTLLGLRSADRMTITEKRALLSRSISYSGPDPPEEDNFGVLVSPARRRHLSTGTVPTAVGAAQARVIRFFSNVTMQTVEGNALKQQGRSTAGTTEAEATLKETSLGEMLSTLREGTPASFNESICSQFFQKEPALSDANVVRENYTGAAAADCQLAGTAGGDTTLLAEGETAKDAEREQETSGEVDETVGSPPSENVLNLPDAILLPRPSPKRRGQERHSEPPFSPDSSPSLREMPEKNVASSASEEPKVVADGCLVDADLQVKTSLKGFIHGLSGSISTCSLIVDASPKLAPTVTGGDLDNDVTAAREPNREEDATKSSILGPGKSNLSQALLVTSESAYTASQEYTEYTSSARYKRKPKDSEGHIGM